MIIYAIIYTIIYPYNMKYTTVHRDLHDITAVLLLYLSCVSAINTQMQADGIGTNVLEYNILEEQAPETLVGNVRLDAGLDMKYNRSQRNLLRFNFLTESELAEGFFSIHQRTGVIRATKRIDRDTICPQAEECIAEFRVVVQPGEFFQIIEVYIEILDINDNKPVFPIRYMTETILESDDIGAGFAIPEATDPDGGINGIQLYELVSNSNKFDLLTVKRPDGSTDLRLMVKEAIDHEQEDFYQITVLARDGGEPVKTGTLLIDITILDANDNDPIFENSTYAIAVLETLPLGATLLRVHASDPDAGRNGEIAYRFNKETNDAWGHVFAIQGARGDIILRQELDYEENDVYQLGVTARDEGADSFPAEALVIVRVLDVNDNAPEIVLNTLTTPGQTLVSENEDPGAFVAYASVIDLDSGRNGKFNCHLNNRNFTLKKRYQKEYTIETAVTFDREVTPFFDVTLTCRDHGTDPQTSRATIRVTVMDLNDHAPQFTRRMYEGTIIENNELHDIVMEVLADDPDGDANGEVTYALEDADNLFIIDEYTGQIIANVVFDHEVMGQVQFHVTASDGGDPVRTSRALVVINIQDVDDEVPHFVQNKYAFGTFENQPPNSAVGKVVAIDRDSPPFNGIRYSLDTVLSATDTFDVDPDTGAITTRSVLNREEIPVYQLIVVATSINDPGYQTSATVTVYVADKNDHAPVFDFPVPTNDTAYVSTKAPRGYTFTRLRGHDDDSGSNARLLFLITAGNADQMFTIDSSTGAVGVNVMLTELDGKQFNLEVTVRDSGDPPLAVTSHLTIIVTDSVALLPPASSGKARMALQSGTLVIMIIFAIVTLMVSVVIVVVIVFFRRRDKRRRSRNHHANGIIAKDKKKKLSEQNGHHIGNGTNIGNGGGVCHVIDATNHKPPAAAAALAVQNGDPTDTCSSFPPPPSSWLQSSSVDSLNSSCHPRSYPLVTFTPMCVVRPSKQEAHCAPGFEDKHLDDKGIATASPGGHHHGDHDSDSGSSATVSNSDSGRGASSEEGDVNTRLSLEALDEAPNEDGSPETEPTASSSLLGHTRPATKDEPPHPVQHPAGHPGGPDCVPAGSTVTTPLIKPQVHLPPQYHQLAASRPLSPHRGSPLSPSAGLYSSRPDVARVGSPLSSQHNPQGPSRSGSYELRRPPQWPPELAKQPPAQDAPYSPSSGPTAGTPPPNYPHSYRTLPAVGGRQSPSMANSQNSLQRPQKHTTFNPHLQYIPHRDSSPQPQSHCDSDSSVDTVISALDRHPLDRHRDYGTGSPAYSTGSPAYGTSSPAYGPNSTPYNPDIMPIRDSAV